MGLDLGFLLGMPKCPRLFGKGGSDVALPPPGRSEWMEVDSEAIEAMPIDRPVSGGST